MMRAGELCTACYGAPVAVSAGPGRSVADSNGKRMPVPADFTYLECPCCGEIWLDAAQSKRMAALSAEWRKSQPPPKRRLW